MSIIQNVKQNKSVLFLFTILFIGILCRLFVIWNWKITDIISTYVSDDMFYYLKIARNIASHQGAQFDYHNPTNGFHPLYMLILVCFFKFLPFFSTYAMRLTLSFLACIQVFTAYFLYKILSHLVKDTSAIFIGILFFVFHPFNFFVGLSGVESPLAVFFLSLSVYWYLHIKIKNHFHIQQITVLGVLLGLSFLARTSTSFFITGILLAYFIQRILIQKNKLQVIVKDFFWIGTASLCIISPWFIWSILTFKTITQDSMNAITFWSENIIALIPSVLRSPSLSISGKFAWMLRTAHQVFFDFNTLAFVILCLLPLILSAYYGLRRKKVRFGEISILFSVSLMTGILWIFYFFYLGHIQHWYFLSSFLCAVLFITLSLSIIFVSCRNTALKFSLKIIITLTMILSFASQTKNIITYGFYPWHKDHLKMAKIIHQKVSRDAYIGSFNAGIYSVFSKRTVINLDGVTNHSVLPYLKKGALMEYLEKEKITHIVDYQYFTDFIPARRKNILWQENTPVMGTIILFELIDSNQNL